MRDLNKVTENYSITLKGNLYHKVCRKVSDMPETGNPFEGVVLHERKCLAKKKKKKKRKGSKKK